MSSFRVIQALGYLGGTVIVIGGFKMILSEYERLSIFEAKLSPGNFLNQIMKTDVFFISGCEAAPATV